MNDEILQGTDDWKLQRAGKVTASRVGEVMVRTKTGAYGAGRKNYMADLVIERLTGLPKPKGFESPEMRWGTEQEPFAKNAYAFRTGVDILPAGFVDHPKIKMTGASPDGYIDDNGLVEFKCPNTATHLETLLGAEIDRAYMLQMQWQMECTGRTFCDWVSFDPRLPETMSLFIRRVRRDDKLIAEIKSEVGSFLQELDDTVARLKERYG